MMEIENHRQANTTVIVIAERTSLNTELSGWEYVEKQDNYTVSKDRLQGNYTKGKVVMLEKPGDGLITI